MAYIGREPTFGAFETQDFVGTGSQTDFTLDFVVSTASSLAIWVNNVSQVPNTHFNTIGNILRFVTAPVNSATIKVVYLGRQHLVPTVADGSVNEAKITNGAVTTDKIASNAVNSTKIDIFKDTPNASSIYEIIDSTDKGVLFAPKLTEAQRDAISGPATGLVLYNTDKNKLNIYNGSKWENLGGGDEISVTNAADIFTNFVKDMEDHGRTSLHTEAGFVDELEASNDMIDEANSSGFGYDATGDFYTNLITGANDNVEYTTESNYIQQEWTNSNQSTSQATVGLIGDPDEKIILNFNNNLNDTSVNNLSASSWTTGDVAFSSGVTKFGSHSLEFSSGSGDTHRFLYNTNPTSLADDILNSDTWTVEFWYRQDHTPSGGDIYVLVTIAPEGVWFDATPRGITLEVGATNNLFYVYTSGTTAGEEQDNLGATGISPTANTWIHYAVTFENGNLIKVYVDGVLKVSQTIDPFTGTSTNAKFQIGERGVSHNHTIFGGNAVAGQKAYIDDFRASTDLKYTSNFTPPTSELTGGQINGVSLSSGNWPSNCDNGRISFDSGSTWFDIDKRKSNTILSLTTLPTAGTSDYIIRLSEFDSGKVELNDVSGNNPINVSTSIVTSESHNSNISIWTDINSASITDSVTGNGIKDIDNNTVSPAQNRAFGFNGADAVEFQGNTFIPNTSGVLTEIKCGMAKLGSPTDDVFLTIFATTAGSGNNDVSNNIPTGSVLATSDSVSGTTFPGNSAPTDNISFTFSGANQINLTAGVEYAYVAQRSGALSSTDYYAHTVSNATGFGNYLEKEPNSNTWETSRNSILDSSYRTHTYEVYVNLASANYWLGFNPASGYGAGTEAKIFHQGDSVWRTIAKNNAGTWEYNSFETDKTELLLNANGSDGATTMTVEGSIGGAFTFFDNAQLDTAEKKFGTSSIQFDGTGDYVQSTNSNSAFALGTDDFTIDYWIKWTTVADNKGIWGLGGPTGGYFYYGTDSGTGSATLVYIYFEHPTLTNWISAGAITLPGGAPTPGTWYHHAFVKQGSVITFYENGVSGGTTGSTIVNNGDLGSFTESKWRLGGRPLNDTGSLGFFDGHIDSFRVTRKVLWTSNFSSSLPTEPVYNSSGPETYTGTAASTNDFLHAVSQGVKEIPENRMSKADIEAISDAEFEATDGFNSSTHTSLFRGVTLQSTNVTNNISVDSYGLNYDANGAIDLRTKQWTGTNGTPDAPSTSPETIYLFVVDEQTTGTPQYAVTRDGTNYINATFDRDWVFSGTKRARRATIDVSSQPAGTDPRVKITTLASDDFKLHAVGLQTKS